METRRLRYFIAVAEERHFRRAAERLHIAQPPLSQQIKLFEQELGAKLLERTTRSVEITPAGELLYERGKRILHELEVLESDVARVGSGVAGILRVGFAGSATYSLMPTIVEHANYELPHVELRLHGEMDTDELADRLMDSRLDVAFLRPPVDHSDISTVHLLREPLVLATASDSPFAGTSPIGLDELRGATLVSYTRESVVSQTTLDAFRSTGFIPKIAHYLPQTSTLLSFVAAGAGLALVPSEAQTQGGESVMFRPIHNAPTVALAVAWRGGKPSRLIARFVDLVSAVTGPVDDPPVRLNGEAPDDDVTEPATPV